LSYGIFFLRENHVHFGETFSINGYDTNTATVLILKKTKHDTTTRTSESARALSKLQRDRPIDDVSAVTEFVGSLGISIERQIMILSRYILPCMGGVNTSYPQDIARWLQSHMEEDPYGAKKIQKFLGELGISSERKRLILRAIIRELMAAKKMQDEKCRAAKD
jgi:hypothetical protein